VLPGHSWRALCVCARCLRSALTNVEFSGAFIFKTAIKGKPVISMCATLVGLLLVVGYSLRLIESIVCASDLALGCLPMPLQDSVWVRPRSRRHAVAAAAAAAH
jgi:hypothetical protein